jgi:hypothetical protein
MYAFLLEVLYLNREIPLKDSLQFPAKLFDLLALMLSSFKFFGLTQSSVLNTLLSNVNFLFDRGITKCKIEDTS